MLPCGASAVLLESADADERRSCLAALQAAGITEAHDDVLEVVPADRTVLVHAISPASLGRLLPRLRALDLDSAPEVENPASADDDVRPLEIPTRYDGADLAEVADLLGVDVAEVVARHTGQLWTVEFAGFAPGFGYLLGDEGGLDVARRESPRPRIARGSVALAGAYSGVYPQASSGGWQLIGRTDLATWDAERDPPALLTPGRRVRFVDVDVDADADAGSR